MRESVSLNRCRLVFPPLDKLLRIRSLQILRVFFKSQVTDSGEKCGLIDDLL